jgi:hypothetical protein
MNMRDGNDDNIAYALRKLGGRKYSTTTIIDALLDRCGNDDAAKLMLLVQLKHNNWRLRLDPPPVNVPLAVGLAYRAAVEAHGSIKAAIAALRAEATRSTRTKQDP